MQIQTKKDEIIKRINAYSSKSASQCRFIQTRWTDAYSWKIRPHAIFFVKKWTVAESSTRNRCRFIKTMQIHVNRTDADLWKFELCMEIHGGKSKTDVDSSEIERTHQKIEPAHIHPKQVKAYTCPKTRQDVALLRMIMLIKNWVAQPPVNQGRVKR